MNKLLDYILRILKVDSLSNELPIIDEIKTQAFLEGYERGRKDKEIEMIFATVTPNMIREACGLEHIEEGETEWQQHLMK